MKLNATLDVNVVAHESEDELAVLVDLEAPTAPELEVQRAPASLQIVLDRSGSMTGAPLEGAKRPLIELVHRIEARDNFGVVTFDHTAEVVVPAGPLTDKDATIARIAAIHAGGSTDLGAGYLRGLREVKRVATQGATMLVISDGHVNQGITLPDQFASLAAKAYADRTVTSTLGYGRGYDESALVALARDGSGNHAFADDPDAAAAAIAGEVGGLLEKVVQAATLTVRFEPMVELLRLYNDLPAQQIGNGAVMIEIGDFYAAESRKLLMKFKVPAMAALGLEQIATLELEYVELPGLVEHTVRVPLSVNVVPGDEAAQRLADPTVHSEVLFQEAQEAKRLASQAYESGDIQRAELQLSRTRTLLDDAGVVAPAALAFDIARERDDVARMQALSGRTDSAYMSKLTRESHHRQNRKRGRRSED